jgi:hypothetical protein
VSEPEQSASKPSVSSNTGRLERVEEKTTSIAAQVAAIPGRILRPTAYLYLVLLGLGGVGSFIGVSFAGDQVDSRADKRVASAIRESEAKTKRQLDEHEAAERARAEARDAALKAEVKAAVDEVKAQQMRAEEVSARRFEVTINTVLEGRLQPGTRQLSQPQTKDGGPP